MPTKTRILFVCVVILLGGVLFGYCAALYPMESLTQVDTAPTTVCDAQVAPDQEASTGQPEQVPSAPPSQTRSQSKPRQKVGAT